MQLFKTFTEAEEFLENLETDLDRIDCLDYLIFELEEKTLASDALDSKNSLKSIFLILCTYVVLELKDF